MAESEAEAETGTQFFLFDMIKKTLTKMFDEFMGGVSGSSPIPHAREYMGCEVNLIGANKNAEGEGAGAEKARTKEEAWLGGMPGMKQFADIFGA